MYPGEEGYAGRVLFRQAAFRGYNTQLVEESVRRIKVCRAIRIIRVLVVVALVILVSCRPVTHSHNQNANSQSTQPKPQTAPPVFVRHPQLQAGSIEFALRLLQSLYAEHPNSNLCFSPLDIQQGLTLLLNGLQAESYQEIADALGYNSLSLEEINAFHRAAWEQIHTEGNAYEVRQAIALLTVAPFRWTATVKQQVQGWYPVAFFELERARLQQQIGQVQAWLQKQTKNQVMLSPEVWLQAAHYPTLAGIVSALYLRAEWEQPFGAAPPIEFRTADGLKRGVPAMVCRYERLPYLEASDFESVVLPYRGGQLRFYLFLPRDEIALEQWVKRLDGARWRAWRKQFKEREVELWMPKFEIATEHDWQALLRQMGIRRIFQDAGLRGVLEGAEKGGYMGLWAQAAVVRVDERGTEAAAGTFAPAFVQDYETVRIVVDRPFLFAIVHEPTELILFLGLVQAP